MMIGMETKPRKMKKEAARKSTRFLLILLSSVVSWPPKLYFCNSMGLLCEKTTTTSSSPFTNFIQTFTCVGRKQQWNYYWDLYSAFLSVVSVNLFFSLSVIKINKPGRCTVKNSRHKQIPMKTPSTFITLKLHATHFTILFRFLCSRTTDDFDVAVIKVQKCVYNFMRSLFLFTSLP